MVKFIADSSCDILDLEGANFEAVAMKISTNDKDYTDDSNLDVHEMLDYMEHYKGRSYTACPSSEGWINAFRGADEIYVVTITSGLSGTYSSAKTAADMYLEENPDVKIHVFDSLSTGPEMRMALEKLVELKNEGKKFDEVVQIVEDYLVSTRLFFSFKSLHNLAQNGRIGKVTAQAVGMLNIRIIGTASEDGVINPISKCRGEAKLVIKTLEEIEKAGFKGGKVRICHVENENLGNMVVNAIKEKYKDCDILLYPARGLCSYYCERGGFILGCECE